MHQFARFLGYMFLISGGVMMTSPNATKRMIKVRAEFAHLSPGAMRLLGFVYVLMGGTLVAVTRPSAAEVRIEKAIPSELHKAA